VNKSEKLKNDSNQVERGKKKSKLLLLNNSVNRTQCLIENDYEQMYGEPPPSYKQAKYYPKVNEASLDRVTHKTQLAKKSYFDKEDLENISHIYENIDDLAYHSSRNQNEHSKYHHNSSQSSKRSKFQALKKHSNMHSSTRKMREQSTTESNDESVFETNTITSQQQQQQQQQNVSKISNDKIELKSNSEHFI
jgi:hypothetical protein